MVGCEVAEGCVELGCELCCWVVSLVWMVGWGWEWGGCTWSRQVWSCVRMSAIMFFYSPSSISFWFVVGVV